MAANQPTVHAGSRRSPLRALVLGGMAAFWAALLLALGVPGAGPFLLAALAVTAILGTKQLIAGSALGLPDVPARVWLTRVRGVRVPRVPVRAALRRVELPRIPRAALPAGLFARPPRPLEPPVPVVGGRAGEAPQFCRLGAQLRQQGRLAAAVESFETAIWIFRDLEDRRGLALALNGLGLALVRQRRLELAVERYREAAALLDGLGDGHAHGQVLANLGTALRSQGRSDEARASWEDALSRLEPGSAEYARISELRTAS